MVDLIGELADEVRCFPVRRNFVVVYRPFDDGIHVLRIFHSARDWIKAFLAGES